MQPVLAYLGLGANEGDRERNIRTALERLASVPGVRLLRASRLLPSPPLGAPPAGAPPPAEFLNGVAELQTTLPAEALLAVCKALELEAGRRLPAPRHANRPLDLDILLYGTEHIDRRELVVPHPRLWERPFVLEPLRELGVDLAAWPRPERPRVLREATALTARCSEWL